MSTNFYITYVGATGQTLKATVERLSDGYYRASGAETFSSGPSFSSKGIALIEGSIENPSASENANTYSVTLDSSGWSDGKYRIRIHDTANSNQTIAATITAVKNGQEVPLGEESDAFDIYHADINFIVDNTNSQDKYEVTWYKNDTMLSSGITSPTIQVIKRTDASNLIASTSMTEVGSTGTYKYTATSTARQTAGELYRVYVTASINGVTRPWSKNIGRDAS